MTTSDRAPEVDLFADTGPINWDGIPSDHSSQEDGLESGEIEQSHEEHKRQAALARDMQREAEQKERDEKRRLEEEEKGRASKNAGQKESSFQHDNYTGGSKQHDSPDNDKQWWKKKTKKKKKKNAETITCEICDIKCTGRAAYDNHLQGQKHRKKERQAILNGSVNKDLNSHYRNATAIQEKRAGPSHVGQYVDLDKPGEPLPPARTQTPGSSLPSYNRHYMAPPSYHPHQEHVKPRDSPVTADPRPHSPPHASPLPSRLGPPHSGPDGASTSPRLTNRPGPEMALPTRPEPQHGPTSVPSRQLAAKSSPVGVNGPSESARPGTIIPVDGAKGSEIGGKSAEETRNAEHVAEASDGAPVSVGPEKKLTPMEIERPAEMPFVQHKVPSAVIENERSAESCVEAGKLVNASGTEAPRESDLNKSQSSAKKASAKTFTSVVTPRPFVKTGSRRKVGDGKPLEDGGGFKALDNLNAPSRPGLSTSHHVSQPGPNSGSDPLTRNSNNPHIGQRSSDTTIATKKTISGTEQNLARSKGDDVGPVGVVEPFDVTPAADKRPVTPGGKAAGGVLETKAWGIESHKQSDISETTRHPRGGHSLEGSAAAERNDHIQTVREAPRPVHPQPLPSSEGPYTKPMIKSAPEPPGNERKRKRNQDDGNSDRMEGHSADRSNVDDRRASNGDRRYEGSGSQRRRLEDVSERESRRRDRHTDYEHEDRRGRDDRRENRWLVDDLREDRRVRDRDPRGREDARDERRMTDDSRDNSRGRNDNLEDWWRRDELREDPRAKEDRREDRATREDWRDSRRRRDDRRVDGRGREESREDRWRRDDLREERRAQDDRREDGKAREDWRDDRHGREDPRNGTRGRNDSRDERHTRDDYRKDRRSREEHRERRDRDSTRDVKKGKEDKREVLRGRDNQGENLRDDRTVREDHHEEKSPHINEAPSAGTPTPPIRQIQAKDLVKYQLVSKQWLESPMTVAEWRELRHYALMKGTDADKLAYKIMQEILLSPVVGIDFHNLAPLSRALLQNVKDFYFTGDKVLARYLDYPNALINGDRRYESTAKKDDNWAREQTPEYLALCNLHDNIMFSFNPNVDPVMSTSGVADCSDLPPRGSYGVKNQRKGPGASSEGMRAPRYPDAVSEDPLFQKISAYLRSRNSSTRENNRYPQR